MLQVLIDCDDSILQLDGDLLLFLDLDVHDACLSILVKKSGEAIGVQMDAMVLWLLVPNINFA
jgi:hypothetical protein